MSLKITGGTARGRSVSSPQGLEARPTSSKVREALFNILGPRVPEAAFLDLFAGSGIIGIEALSRGARTAIFVEQNSKRAQEIRRSLDQLGLDGEVITGDVRQTLSSLPEDFFDIIFADPPYRARLGQGTLHSVARHKLLKEEGILVLEHLRAEPPEECALSMVRSKDYGQTSLSFFAPPQENQEETR